MAAPSALALTAAILAAHSPCNAALLAAAASFAWKMNPTIKSIQKSGTTNPHGLVTLSCMSLCPLG
jgi:hypothetical protein